MRQIHTIIFIMFLFSSYATAQEEIDADYHLNAAKIGNISSQLMVAHMYNYGRVRGVPIDYVKARYWYRKLAERTYSDYNIEAFYTEEQFLKYRGRARFEIGFFYWKDVPRNEIQAAEWFRKAAIDGNANAISALGMFYHQGLGGYPKNYTTARELYNLAKEKGSDDAHLGLERLEQDERNGIFKGLSYALLAWALYDTFSNDNSSHSNSSQTTQEDNAEYNKCRNQAIGRIGSCRVMMSSESCSMTSCPPHELKCNESSQGRDCPIDSGIEYYTNEFGFKKFYCDTENARNHDRDVNVVINNICSTN